MGSRVITSAMRAHLSGFAMSLSNRVLQQVPYRRIGAAPLA
jgi:hypothetical protein